MKVVEPATKVVESDADIFVFELCWFGLLVCVGFVALRSSFEFGFGFFVFVLVLFFNLLSHFLIYSEDNRTNVFYKI